MPIAVFCDVLMRTALGQRTCFSPTPTQNCQQTLQTSTGMVKIAGKIRRRVGRGIKCKPDPGGLPPDQVC
ncbi:hypothetical protein THS27_11505 [Thalassospira sp. MCCC 1A01428]|nr:hypothetical protein THS27_11505 [Thalassospira sp. MCCC 1A01428]